MLRLPDLEQAKPAVLNSLSSIHAQRGYRHAIDEFVNLPGAFDHSDLATAVARWREQIGDPTLAERRITNRPAGWHPAPTSTEETVTL